MPSTIICHVLLGVGVVMSTQMTMARAQTTSVDRSTPPELGPLPKFSVPQLQYFRLANGLEVIFVERSGTRLADATLALRGGASADPAQLYGLADWTSSLLSEGAGGRDALGFADAVDFLGARLDTFASWDAMSASLHVPAERLGDGLDLLADAVMRPRFEVGEWQRLKAERETAFVEVRSDAMGLSHLAVLRAVFDAQSRYHVAMEGTPASLGRVTIEDIRQFHARFARPDNAVLAVAADLPLATVQAHVERVFAAWAKPATALQLPAVSTGASPVKAGIVIVDKADAPQSVLAIASPLPDGLAPLDAPTEVVNTILGGAFTSRLNMNLREEHGYTYGVRSGFEFWRGGGIFRVGTSVATAVTAPALAQAMKELDGIREPVPAEELAKARTYRAMTFPTNFETGHRTADLFIWAATLSLAEERVSQFMSRVEAVDAKAAQDAALRAIDPASMFIVIVGDKAKIQGPLAELKIGPVSVWTIAQVID